MVSVTFTALLGLLSAASAMPHAARDADLPAEIAAIMATPQDSFTSYKVGGLIREGNATNTPALDKRCTLGTNEAGACCTTLGNQQLDWGETDGGGWGITVQNGDSANYRGFYFYENNCDTVPYKYTWVAPGATIFITLPWNFHGRMTRGNDAMNLKGTSQRLGTWFEFNWEVDPAGVYTGAWADISVIRGCDAGMMTWAMDGTGAWKGFTYDILAAAPSGAFASKDDGARVLSPTEDGGQDLITVAYELTRLDTTLTYLDDSHGNPVYFSKNGRIGVYVPAGVV